MVENTPIAKKIKWGWGWIILILLILPSFQRLSRYNAPISYLIMIFGPILLPVFYFWYRRKLLIKYQRILYRIKAWPLSLNAGFVTCLIALALILIAAYLGSLA